MEPETKDAPEVLETQEGTETTETAPAEEELDIEALKAEAAKAKELEAKNRQLFERAKKAEEAKKEPSQDLAVSPKDYIALTEAKVSAEDFDEVADFAKFKGVSIAEALKNSTLKTILNERAEERKTAQATATKGTARGSTKPSEDALLERASRGESLSEDSIAALARARHQRHFKK